MGSRSDVKTQTVDLHLPGRWLSGSNWPFGQICSLCNCATASHCLKFSLSLQNHIWNYVLMFYVYGNKYVARNNSV